MSVFLKYIFSAICVAALSACSETPNCESQEVSNYFKENFSPGLNKIINSYVTYSPVSYALDAIETVKRDKELDTYSCKGVLRLNLSEEENKTLYQLEEVAKKDADFVKILEKELMEKGIKRNGVFFGISLVKSIEINGATLRQNDKDPKKYRLDFPVEFSTHKIKSSAEKFQIKTDLNTEEASELLEAHGILFARLGIAKNFLDHPEVIAKIKADNAEKEAQKLKEKQDELNAIEAERVVARAKEVEDRRVAEESRLNLMREANEARLRERTEERLLQEKRNEERELKLRELKLKSENYRLEGEIEASRMRRERNQDFRDRIKKYPNAYTNN